MSERVLPMACGLDLVNGRYALWSCMWLVDNRVMWCKLTCFLGEKCLRYAYVMKRTLSILNLGILL